MSARVRPRAAPFSVVGSARELAVVRSIARARFLETTQIARLHFPSRRVAQRRLRALVDHGLLRAHTQGEALHKPNVYTTTARGLEWVAEREGREVEARPGRMPRPQKLGHALAVRDVFVAFAMVHAARAFELVEFRFETDLSNEPILRAAGLVPDGLATVRMQHSVHGVGIEVDLGTETRATLRAKFATWRKVLAVGLNEIHASRFRLLVVAASAGRAESLERLALEADLEPRLVGCMTLREIASVHESGRSHELYAPPRRAVRTGSGFQPTGIVAELAADTGAFRPLRSL